MERVIHLLMLKFTSKFCHWKFQVAVEWNVTALHRLAYKCPPSVVSGKEYFRINRQKWYAAVSQQEHFRGTRGMCFVASLSLRVDASSTAHLPLIFVMGLNVELVSSASVALGTCFKSWCRLLLSNWMPGEQRVTIFHKHVQFCLVWFAINSSNFTRTSSKLNVNKV